jgi:hypothetical protein
MSDLETLAAPAVEKLLLSGPDQLYEQLGLRRKAIEADPTQAGHFDTLVTFNAPFAGPLDALREFGQRFFEGVNSDVYGLVCGNDSAHATERNKVLNAIGGGPTAFAATLAAVLVSTFGWAPALAAVVAALVVKLFFKNAHAATCEVWRKHLPKPAKPTLARGKRAATVKKKGGSGGRKRPKTKR